MLKLKKGFISNILLVLVVAIIFLNTTVYGIDFKFTLRLPHQISTEEGRSRLKEMKWETTMADPIYHEEKKFRYIVHAVRLPEERVVQMLFMTQRQKEGERIDRNGIELLKNPERISQKPIISGSFVLSVKVFL